MILIAGLRRRHFAQWLQHDSDLRIRIVSSNGRVFKAESERTKARETAFFWQGCCGVEQRMKPAGAAMRKRRRI